jgi:hypothetical protein
MMLKAIAINKLTAIFIVYAGLSLIIHLWSAFTSMAWIIYIFTLAPFYGFCSLWLVSIIVDRSKPQPKLIRYRVWLLLPIVMLQALVILCSPASCYGWHQGASCYSFLQMHADKLFMVGAISDRPHWQIESMFVPALFIYMLSIIYFWLKCRREHAS